MLDVQRIPAAAESVARLDNSRHQRPYTDAIPYIRRESPLKMPVDFASYLLAASPPSVDLRFTLRDHFGLNGCKATSYANIKSIISKSDSSLASIPGHDDFDRATHTLQTRCCSSPAAFYQVYVEPPRRKVPAPPRNGRRNSMGKKKVSFADDLGMALVSIRLMTEPSDTPPRIHPEVLSSLRQGTAAAAAERPPLVLNFSQPASNYLAFRERLESGLVSLENVVLRDYTLVGTIKVKNVSFEKLVTVRHTFDSWDTSGDIEATYVDKNEPADAPYNTFSFELHVPPTMDVHKRVQFCVAYDVVGRRHWDNNNGLNYEVMSADWTARKPVVEPEQPLSPQAKQRPRRASDADTVFALDMQDHWAEYSWWQLQMAPNDGPYW